MDGGGLSWWTVIGLVLIIEGLMPFVSPSGWRKMFLQLLTLEDGHIRRMGLFSIALGLCVLWWLK